MKYNRWDIAKEVSRLQPGESLTISGLVLRDIETISGWTVADSIMENIIGSAYDIAYSENPATQDIMFSRLNKPKNDGLRTYVSPDRRHWFNRRTDGLWEPNVK